MPVAKLDNAPRCQHTKLNGQPCAAPARRGIKYCVFHAAEHTKTPDYVLHIVEDAMTLQHSLFQVMRLLAEKTVDTKRVALMLYALQIAASNLKRLHQEGQQIAQSAEVEQEQSWIKQLLDSLQMPMTEAERIAEESVAESERLNSPGGLYDFNARLETPPPRPPQPAAIPAALDDCSGRGRPGYIAPVAEGDHAR